MNYALSTIEHVHAPESRARFERLGKSLWPRCLPSNRDCTIAVGPAITGQLLPFAFNAV
jgi:hypothetical protein